MGCLKSGGRASFGSVSFGKKRECTNSLSLSLFLVNDDDDDDDDDDDNDVPDDVPHDVHDDVYDDADTDADTDTVTDVTGGGDVELKPRHESIKIGDIDNDVPT